MERSTQELFDGVKEAQKNIQEKCRIILDIIKKWEENIGEQEMLHHKKKEKFLDEWKKWESI
ncbi:hypothetical protein H0A61_02155 [Koleobacter methoxysyntrophicus]|uniref:Uncharacterized protein n=1 Tax=Koleobacter methoxysyntrophicus TaxID=2751313 RepID=A0A8A0RPD1_9FIRM|nr:hypothetical protein [Koleobacter methoxysyntrophicus]QSQ09774.1 hypothetical protein H0A61_02155 [Koleobacter methoxysyntrophicus]